MPAFENPNASQVINTHDAQATAISTTGANDVVRTYQVVPDACTGKSYNAKNVKVLAKIADFPVDAPETAKITIEVRVNDELKASQAYKSGGFNCDAANSKKAPAVNVSDLDVVTATFTAVDLASDIAVSQIQFLQSAGAIEGQIC